MAFHATLPYDQSFPRNLTPFDLAPQNGPELFLDFDQACPGPVTAQNNNQLSIRTSERPLHQQPHLEEFKFHYLLQRNGCRMTTLRKHPLRFIVKSQEIFHADGTPFLFTQNIRSVVLEAKRLGDGCKKTVQVPFNNVEERFARGEEGSTEEDAILWIRVFEVGPECVADTETIEAIFNLAETQYKCLKKICEDSQNSSVDRWVQSRLRINRKAYAELYEAWMDATTWACTLCKKMFSDKSRLHAHTEAEHTPRFVELE